MLWQQLHKLGRYSFFIFLRVNTIGNEINGGFRQLQLQGIYTICLESFYFPQTISHQFLIADKLYPQITGNISSLIQIAIAKIPYTSRHRTILIWSFGSALKNVICFLSEYDNHSDNKISLPFMGKYLWTFAFNYSIKYGNYFAWTCF